MIKENRAWFIAEDGRVPQSFWVMMDQSKWVNIDFTQSKEQDLKEIKVIKFNVRDNKWAKVDYIKAWDFLPNNIWAPLANEKALKLLGEIAPGEFQAIPTEVIMPDGYIIKEYKLINVIKKVPGLLLEHSILNPKAKEIDDFSLHHYKLIYHKLDALGDFNLAREQKLTGALYGSNKLKEAIKAEKLTGLVFKDTYAGYEFWHGK